MSPPVPRKFARNRHDPRDRFAAVRILVADRDARVANLVQRVLASFGFASVELVTSGEEALLKLAEESFDIIITEWNMAPINGIELVQAIRTAKAEHRLQRDIPIIMLTSYSEKNAVEKARDAGITEFLAKPFSASTLSNRLIKVIDNPRAFVLSPQYSGPCRRRASKPPEGVSERRGREPQKNVQILPPNHTISDRINSSAADLLGAAEIGKAQAALLNAESDFVDWAKDDIANLESAYRKLAARPGDSVAHLALLDTAYAITKQAGTYGYDLGKEVGTLLADYLTTHRKLDESKLTVVRKHIDTISVVFREKIKETGQALGRELIDSLRKLIRKLG